MDYQGGIILIESIIPAAIGGTLCVLEFLGIGEFLKEIVVAFKTESHA